MLLVVLIRELAPQAYADARFSDPLFGHAPYMLKGKASRSLVSPKKEGMADEECHALSRKSSKVTSASAAVIV